MGTPYSEIESWKIMMQETHRLYNQFYKYHTVAELATKNIIEQEYVRKKFLLFENNMKDSIAAFRHTNDLINSTSFHSPAFNAISHANISVAKLADEYQNIKKIAEQTHYLDQSWQKLTKPLLSSLDLLDARRLILENQYSKMMDYSVRAQQLLSKIPWSDFGSALSIQTPLIDRTKSNFVNFTDQYARLVENFSVPGFSIASFPPCVSGLPPVEIFIGSHLVKTISDREPDEDEDTESLNSINIEIEESLKSTLAQIEPKYVQLWKGAKEALQSTNPDRKRHVFISLRELITHILHTLAPDDQIRNWNSDDKLYHNGRPTRKARILFINRFISKSDDTFEKFIEKDVDSTLLFLELFQVGTHELDVHISDTQLHALMIKAESLIHSLISISSDI